MRKIIINGLKYEYSISGRRTVTIINPEEVKTHVNCGVLKGMTPDNFDRGKWKKTSDGMVTPKHIKKYIIENGI